MAIVILANQYGKEIREEVRKFDKSTDINEILGLAVNSWAFRIPLEQDREMWNEIIDEEWGGLDDSDYYQYNKPFAFDDKWVTNYEGYFWDLQTAINELRNNIKFLMKIKDIHGGQF